jgi:hypothetical protein
VRSCFVNSPVLMLTGQRTCTYDSGRVSISQANSSQAVHTWASRDNCSLPALLALTGQHAHYIMFR